ncbi:ribosome small subunit-dependent GTPase A [Christensenellaceae bacterium NSJ-63]|uniref:Small ribosomal subunit biogenesis GTPase RsgA n=1 Tax=Guopingia tenuis TaxID=2763656 RepID=A0A926DHR8_9FIRM|nr:ribosome small subunit-dependent GTPase A [Guopingia tenuis]MBC8538032.1 ribosome small subunit-dependent GTPase A [Guopingia tenuis]
MDKGLHSMEGKILKGIGGFYYVQDRAGAVYECKAKGRFRLEGIKPMPGDNVRFSPPSDTEGGSILEIAPRKNALVRPMVANIDLLLIIVSAGKPKPDLGLVDKLLLYAAQGGIPAAIGVSKLDTDRGMAEEIQREYRGSGAPVHCFSARDGRGIADVAELLRGRCVCLAGQSAVGKSSLLNALSPGLCLETGGLSKKTARGRHTTRFSELLPLPGLGATVIDTPGFSILECLETQPEELKEYYPEFAGSVCRFDGCLHWKEPGCGVKGRIAAGEIDENRYTRYTMLLEELLERRKHQYD